MIRIGGQYRASIRDIREIHINGERVKNVTTHPQFKPPVDIRAPDYDMLHAAATCDVMIVTQNGEVYAVGNALPHSQNDWWAKRRVTDTVLSEIGGVVTRVGDETVGEMWSLFDGQDVLNALDPQFSKNIETHIHKVIAGDPFHVSVNTDPKGDRSKAPSEQDPDMLLHVVKKTDAGIVVRGAKFETGADYANQAFTKPTFAFVQRNLKVADMLIGAALFNARQTGLDKQPAVQEKLAELAMYRESITAHLTAAIPLAEPSPLGLLKPNQSLLMAGRVHACSGLYEAMNTARDLCGRQIYVTPDVAAVESPDKKPWLDKYYTLNDTWVAECRRKLLAFARDLTSFDYAGHRLAFDMFAQSPRFDQLTVVYRNFGRDWPLAFVKASADLADNVMGSARELMQDKSVKQWFAANGNATTAAKTA